MLIGSCLNFDWYLSQFWLVFVSILIGICLNFDWYFWFLFYISLVHSFLIRRLWIYHINSNYKQPVIRSGEATEVRIKELMCSVSTYNLIYIYVDNIFIHPKSEKVCGFCSPVQNILRKKCVNLNNKNREKQRKNEKNRENLVVLRVLRL